MSDAQAPGAKARLQASREALMRELQPRRQRSAAAAGNLRGAEAPLSALPGYDGETEYEHGQDDGDGLWSVTKRSVQAWWEFHPARAAVAIAQPVVAEYAQRRPWKLIGIAAGVGAALVIVRPWKLVSLGGVAVAALKSSQVSNLALSMLASRRKAPKTTTKDHE